MQESEASFFIGYYRGYITLDSSLDQQWLNDPCRQLPRCNLPLRGRQLPFDEPRAISDVERQSMLPTQLLHEVICVRPDHLTCGVDEAPQTRHCASQPCHRIVYLFLPVS